MREEEAPVEFHASSGLRFPQAEIPVEMFVSQVVIYPLKSARGVECTSAELGDRGFLHDRRWMLVDQGGRFLSQRECTRITLIRVDLPRGFLLFEAPGMGELKVAFEATGRERGRVVVWESRVEAEFPDPLADAWFSEFLGIRCRLVFMPEETHREVEGTGPGSKHLVGFADAFPHLLVTEASLSDLNLRLNEPVSMNRFRPNIVIRGSRAFDEDGWKRLRIGTVEFGVIKPCSRCVTTTIDQVTGERGVEPLRTLATFRSKNGKVLFGQNIVHYGAGSVTVGDEVYILE